MSIAKIRNLLRMKCGGKDLEIPGEESLKRESGFSFVEVLVGVGLMGIAMLGLAQLFIFSVKNNSRADQISTASFLGQQQIEQLRSLTYSELNTLNGAPVDEQVDINLDGTIDYRRITDVQPKGANTWLIRILVFTGPVSNKSADELIQNAVVNKVKIDVSTIIGR